MPKKTIKVAFTDFPGPLNPRLITELLESSYNVVIDNENPDYVIYSVFGFDFLKFDNAIRIFFVGENVRPDFNLCDYAFGYDWMDFGDRYFRCPNYALYPDMELLLKKQRSNVEELRESLSNKKFCNFLYHNGRGHPIRDEFFHKLSSYKSVHSAGNHLRNATYTNSVPYAGDWWVEKVNYQREFRFTIAFENSSSPGYTTEKIVHALAADTIPIYWGDPLVAKDWNPRRFINVHDFDGMDSVVRRVKELEENPKQYLDVLAQPFFSNESCAVQLSKNAILGSLASIFEQNKDEAFRRNFYFWGKMYEERYVRLVQNDEYVESRKITGLASRVIRKIHKQLAH
jgi:hypothetical protein